MKKTALFLALILMLSIFTLASCKLFGKNSLTEHVDANNDFICDTCGQELEKTDTPDTEEPGDTEEEEKPAPECKHVDSDKDHKCDRCEVVLTACKDGNADHKCDTCGADLSE